MGERLNPLYVALWIVNVIILLGLAITGVTPLTWGTWFIALFVVPELVGLRSGTDTLPPLTHVVRLWVPRWVTATLTLAGAVWLGVSWWPVAVHPLVMVVLVGGFYGWLHDHWDTVYDNWVKAQLPSEEVVRLWKVGREA
jgi:hypothetical protein